MTSPETSPSDVFNNFVREATERFPELEGRLVIMDVKTRLTYGAALVDPVKTGMTRQDVLDYLGGHEITSYLVRHPDKSSRAFRDPRSGLNIIFFNESVNRDAFNKAVNKAMEKEIRRIKHVLDHELGHLGIEDGYPENPRPSEERLREGVGDAYALMRHYQRFGTERECVDKYVSPFSRANSLIFGGDASHFTCFVLEEIIKCRHTIDFANLSSERTASIARQFARQYMPAIETLREVESAFVPVRWSSRFPKGDQGLQKLIDITLDPKSSYAVFRTGNIWLQKYIEGNFAKFPAMSREDKQTLSRKLQEREYHFARLNKQNRHRATPQEWKQLGLG